MKIRARQFFLAGVLALVFAAPAWADSLSEDVSVVEMALDNAGEPTSPEIDAARELLDSAKAHQSAGRTDEAALDIDEAKRLLTIE